MKLVQIPYQFMDMESIHLYNKQGNPDVGYNLQTAVDSTSKMFMSLIVSKKATDHYQLPEIMNKTIKNMGIMPEYCCADAGYNTRRTLEYLEEIFWQQHGETAKVAVL